MSKTKTNEEFIIELREKNDQIIPQEPYINNHSLAAKIYADVKKG